MNKKPIRQGDILFKLVDSLPKGAKKLKHKTVALGEFTGHSHRFEDNTTELFMLENTMYANVPVTTEIIHEEHKPLVIEKGVYEIGNEREYDYAEESMKKVVD